MSSINCFGHQNGFEHFVIDAQELTQVYDLGYAFQEIDPKEYTLDANTGIKVWAEPRLALYISARAFNFPEELITIRYAVTRTKYAHGLIPTADDESNLLVFVISRLASDIETTKKGIPGEVVSGFIMI